MPKKGKFKHHKSTSVRTAAVTDSGISTRPETLKTQKIHIVSTLARANEERVAYYRLVFSDVRRSILTGAVIFAILILIYLIFRFTHIGGIL